MGGCSQKDGLYNGFHVLSTKTRKQRGRKKKKTVHMHKEAWSMTPDLCGE